MASVLVEAITDHGAVYMDLKGAREGQCLSFGSRNRIANRNAMRAKPIQRNDENYRPTVWMNFGTASRSLGTLPSHFRLGRWGWSEADSALENNIYGLRAEFFHMDGVTDLPDMEPSPPVLTGPRNVSFELAMISALKDPRSQYQHYCRESLTTSRRTGPH